MMAPGSIVKVDRHGVTTSPGRGNRRAKTWPREEQERQAEVHWILVGFLIGIGLILALLASALLFQPATWAVIGIAVGALALLVFAPNVLETLISIPLGLIALGFFFYMGYCVFLIGRGLWHGISTRASTRVDTAYGESAENGTPPQGSDRGWEDGYLHSRSRELLRTVGIGSEMQPLLVAGIHAALQQLAMSDGADGDGFDEQDSALGKDLAAREFLTQSQAAQGRKLAIKYGQQLDPDLLEFIKECR